MAMLTAAQHELRRTNSRLGSREYAPVASGDRLHSYSPTAGAGGDGYERPQREVDSVKGMMRILGEHPTLSSLLIFVPIGFVTDNLEWPDQFVFGANFMAIIPLAWLIGKATEDLSASVGEAVGGLLNATFGNVVEMLLCISGIRNDEIIVTQCTLIGSILSNLLLVMGCAFLVGGCFYKTQRYSAQGATAQCSLMAVAIFAIGLLTIYANILRQDREWEHMLQVSRYSSCFLLFVYIAYLWFQLKTHADLFADQGDPEEEEPDLGPIGAAILLAIATVTTSFCADFLVHAIRGTIKTWNVSQEFIGIVMLPIIGNAAEHYTAIIVAARDKMMLSLGVAAGSSCQMALLVTPFSVLIGWFYDKEMSLDFHIFQVAVLLFAVFLVTTILSTGMSNWLDGLMLLVPYCLLSLIYFFEGSGEDSSLATLDRL